MLPTGHQRTRHHPHHDFSAFMQAGGSSKQLPAAVRGRFDHARVEPLRGGRSAWGLFTACWKGLNVPPSPGREHACSATSFIQSTILMHRDMSLTTASRASTQSPGNLYHYRSRSFSACIKPDGALLLGLRHDEDRRGRGSGMCACCCSIDSPKCRFYGQM